MKKLNYLLVTGLVMFACLGFTSCNDDETAFNIETIADDTAHPANAAEGFYIVNEDWFGHDNGTVNYFKQTATNTYEPSYRVYRAANPGETLGVTSQFGTIYGDNIYIMSKQDNRLVVADASTMKKKAAIETIGGDDGGDGRAIVGVNETTMYVGHSQGIALFDIPSLTIKGQIEGVSGQIGMMTRAGDYVFAISASDGLLIINASTNKLEKTIEGDYYTLTQSKDGHVWVAGSDGLTNFDPATLSSTTVPYPDGGSIGSSWGAWNAGSLCASTQQNVLYWTSGSSSWSSTDLFKYDIATGTATKIYSLGNSDEGTQLVFYGAGVRVDPLTDDLILTVCHSGFGASYAYNWVYKLDNNGKELTHFALKGDNGTGASSAGDASTWGEKYFWFPAVPVFEDANKPQILINQIKLAPGTTTTVNLDEKIIDYDNTLASMQITATADDSGLAEASLTGHVLTVKAGTSTGISSVKISVLSNGVKVEKNIQVAIVPAENL